MSPFGLLDIMWIAMPSKVIDITEVEFEPPIGHYVDRYAI